MSASSKEQWDLEDDARPVNPTDNPTLEFVLAAYLNRRDLLKGAAMRMAQKR